MDYFYTVDLATKSDLTIISNYELTTTAYSAVADYTFNTATYTTVLPADYSTTFSYTWNSTEN